MDYTKSIVMRGEESIQAIEEKATCKEAIEKEREFKRIKVERTKMRRSKKKVQQHVAKVNKEANQIARKAFNDKWSAIRVAKARDDFH
jgi:hypothetical protein